MNFLFELSQAAIERTDTSFSRYMTDVIPWENRMTALIGPRGVGKTTLVLQHIKKHLDRKTTLYVNAESVFFTQNTLFDTALKFHKKMGGTHLFIDEIHKYNGWALELKMMYDNLPDLKIFFTGSSVLDIYKGAADLSRRVLVYQMQGMSFREYLNMSQGTNIKPYTLEEILNHEVRLHEEIKQPLAHFANYLRQGYYPFYGEPEYYMRLNQIVSMSLETDIPQYANISLSVASKLKQLMQIVADSVPFKPVHTKLAEIIKADRKYIADYFNLMERAGLIMQLRENAAGIRALGKTEKMYLDNTNLYYALTDAVPNIGNMRETFFLNQIRVHHQVFNSPISDFQIGNQTFEVGGKGKGQKQIANAEQGYIVKDDIEYGYDNVIPLWHFGMNY